MSNHKLTGCGACMYFQRRNVGSTIGNCRANPPVVIMVGINQAGHPVTDTYWPQVPDTEWCGVWRVKGIGRLSDLSAVDLKSAEVEGEA